MVRTKPQVVLSGFFGRGNCGDEAILQAQYEQLAHAYDVVISVDERGARDGFWDWHPYNRCRIVHQGNLAVLAESGVVGIHVGGGGLPHGFNAAQVVHARSLGKPAFVTGIDARPAASAAASTALKQYLGLFNFVSVRSASAWQTMTGFAPACHYGADWATSLQPEQPAHEPRGGVVVTIREFPGELVSRRYRGDLADLVGVLEAGFGPVTLLPFCPEDERFLEHLPLAGRLPRESQWWNPRRMQRLIADADLVVSLGRLHPLIFAANVGTPAVFAEPLGQDPRWPVCTKVRDLAAEHGWPYAASIADLVAGLRRPDGRAVPPAAFAAGTRDRWRAMADALEKRLAAAISGGNAGNPTAKAG